VRALDARPDAESHGGTSLPYAVVRAALAAWPTPTASRYGSGQNGDPGDGRGAFAGKGAPSLDTLAADAGAPLNPAWVEALMGFPIGWTLREGGLFAATPLVEVDGFPAPPDAPRHAWEPPLAQGRRVPDRNQRLHALGNAVVPAVAELVGRRLLERLGRAR